MNPLDIEELKVFFKTVENDMPIHTDKTTSIKCSYSQGMPKSIKEYSVKIDTKFLDDNLHTIEEMNYRDPSNMISDSLKRYQNKIYDEDGILDHELFFKHEGKIYPRVSGGSFYNQSMLSTSFASMNRTVFGTTLTYGTGASTYGGVIADRLWATVDTGGVTGVSYNTLAIDLTTSVGNYKIGCYNDSSGLPNTRYAATSGHAADSAYTDRTVTEFILSQTGNLWCAVLEDSTNTIKSQTTVDANNSYYDGVTYSSGPPATFGAGAQNNNSLHFKVSYV